MAKRPLKEILAEIRALVVDELGEGESLVEYLGRVEASATPLPERLIEEFIEATTQAFRDDEEFRDARATLAKRALRGEDLFPR